MSDPEKTFRGKVNYYTPYNWSLVVVATVVLAASYIWNIHNVNETKFEVAKIQARTAYNKDILYRRWNSEHGGVYVPVTEHTQPNIYLEDLPERDIIGPSGKPLTLMNPAYMTRQVHEIEGKISGVRGHITSLNPLNEDNNPDSWEREVLKAFNNGITEVISIEELDSVEYLRLMRPLEVEKGCVKCHEDYELGDIRGGISVALPMGPLNKIAREDIRSIGIVHLLLWGIGLFGLAMGARRIGEREVARVTSMEALAKSENRYRNLSGQLEMSNNMKELLLDIITHDLKNPAGVISGMSDLLLEENPGDEMTQMIKYSSDDLLRVISNTTTLAKVTLGEEIEKESLDLVTMLQQVSSEFEPMLKDKGMDLNLNLPDRLIVKAHPIIAEVFKNYISNAVKYAPEGKNVDVESEEDADSVKIVVKDYGETISAEDRERVFLRTIQLSNGAKRGRGLGLAIVQRIAEAHGGEVGVEPNQPQGNVFYFKLPKGSN